MSVSRSVLRYSTLNNGVTLKSWLLVVQGHWKWPHSIDHIRLTLPQTNKPVYCYMAAITLD